MMMMIKMLCLRTTSSSSRVREYTYSSSTTYYSRVVSKFSTYCSDQSDQILDSG